MIELLKKEEVKKFIEDHRNEDSFQLALTYPDGVAGVDIKLISAQIRAGKKAKKKIPDSANNPDILYPDPLIVEQCSSELTAAYKTNLAKEGRWMIDLTGGLGVDTYFLSKKFERVTMVEADHTRAEYARHNFDVLGANNIEVIHTSAEVFLSKHLDKKADLIYVDPDRRVDGNDKNISLENSLPNLLGILDRIISYSGQVLIKTSPVLDLKDALRKLQKVNEVHVISVKNDVKEVIYDLQPESEGYQIYAADHDGRQWNKYSGTPNDTIESGEVDTYLYEPLSVILKAQIQNSVSKSHNLLKLHPNTNLFTSSEPVEDFPGRVLSVIGVCEVSRKALKKSLPEMRGNLVIRNFPGDMKLLKKKLGILDGGNKFVYACQLKNGRHKLLIAKKIT